MSVILTIVLAVASATADIRHYCDTTFAIPGLTIQGTPDYSTSYSYDLNGNPTQIYRKGIAHKYASGSNRQWQYDEIDNLYIDYRGNQVNFTDDSCPWGYYENAPGYIEESNDDNEYTWDANGNMTKDLNRGITSIQYNLQNMPTRIVYNDRHYEGRTYNSAGQKLRTIHTVLVTSSTSSSTSTSALITENKRDYYGEDLVYRNDTLEMVLTDVGYVDASGRYHYYILDYQGNVRQVIDAQGEVLEQNDYYPYGGLFGESASRQNYKYSGKEMERMNSLNTYDFHARPYYYPTLQFHSPDLLSENTPWLSPYLYCAANPIMFIDPTGMDIWRLNNHGYVVDVEETTEYDKLEMIDDEEKSIKFEHGTIISQKSYNYEDGKTYDVWKVRGDDNATQMFEFMSDNITGSDSKVEIGLAQTGIAGDKGLNFITTGHARGSEPGLSYLFLNQLQNGYAIRTITHSHPNSFYPSNGDFRFSMMIFNQQKSNNFTPPNHYIYQVQENFKFMYFFNQ